MRALIMAGGEGRRLQPLTRDTPKPLLPVAGRPILEHLLVSLRHFGVNEVTLAVAHLAEKIELYFGSGVRHGIGISYLQEKVPLGTAGALSLLDNFQEPILLINADILTDLNFHQLMDQHRYRNAVLTVASKVLHTNLDLGVLDVDSGGLVEAYREKPRLTHRFGIGIYVVDPSVRQFVPLSKRLDMPELINTLIAARYPVACYEHSGNWVDIGTHEEYARLKENAWVHALTDSKALGAMVAASVSSDIVYP